VRGRVNRVCIVRILRIVDGAIATRLLPAKRNSLSASTWSE
jgi:hypothetical protein